MTRDTPARVLRDFQDAAQLDDATLSRILERSDPVERMWAVWALGLRASAEARALALYLEGEPEPGVRRALAVVLAGQGQVDLLVALCRHDADAKVRASAAQLLMRFATAGRVPWSVVYERFADASEVKEALLGQITPPASPELCAAVLSCLNDGVPSVRMEAFEAAVRLHSAGQIPDRVLREWLDQASPDDRDGALRHWLTIEPQAVLVRTLAGASHEAREHAIRRLPSAAFLDVLPLVEDDADLFRDLGFDVRAAGVSITLVAKLASLPYAQSSHLAEAQERLAVLDRATPALAALLPALRLRCAERLQELDELLSSPERLAEYGDEGIGRDDLEEERASMNQLQAHIGRLSSAP